MKNSIPYDIGRSEFIKENREFIYSIACRICKRKLDWQNDDEISISLIAFDKACNAYNENKGNFHVYASILIKNALIDFFRKSGNNPSLIFNDNSENMDYIDYKNSLNEFEKSKENKQRAEEIALFSKKLADYNIDFDMLVESSPSHKDTRNDLLNVALMCLNNEEIMNYLKEKKMLPVKKICDTINKKRKFIENWRRYLIVLIIILSSNDYPYIKSYLNIGERDQ